MKLSNRTRYQPVDNGYEIIGSREFFNRTLYGAHTNDDLQERYFTFAGDLPLFMGAVTDWTKNNWGNYAKSGVLMSGLALAPGLKIPSFYSQDVDVSSHWFHTPRILSRCSATAGWNTNSASFPHGSRSSR